jgi:hypothetical protein
MPVRGNNRQKNFRCYRKLERQLIIEWEYGYQQRTRIFTHRSSPFFVPYV